MRQKVVDAVDFIRREVNVASRPIVLSSFGKDSMVLLALVKLAGFKLPILFFKEPFFPTKYSFANYIIQQEGYTVYDYPPTMTAVAQNADAFEIINYHQVGEQVLYLPTGISVPKTDEPFLCGLNDIYLKPTCVDYHFPWDLLLIGHKSSDIDPIFGPVPLKDKVKDGARRVVFPLADFTDSDIWAFTEAAGLPINRDRYDASRAWGEFKDQTWNPDYFPACVACMDKNADPLVKCPKTGGLVRNVSDWLDSASPARLDYFAELVNA